MLSAGTSAKMGCADLGIHRIMESTHITAA